MERDSSTRHAGVFPAVDARGVCGGCPSGRGVHRPQCVEPREFGLAGDSQGHAARRNVRFCADDHFEALGRSKGVLLDSAGQAKAESPARPRKWEQAIQASALPRRSDGSYGGSVCAARQRMPLGFWMALLAVLAERFQEDHPEHLKFKGFRLLAMDGTTLALPRSAKLSEHYGIPKNGQRKRAAPQARMVMLTLPGVRVPLAYEAAPLAQSELELAERLMQHVRAN